MIKKKKQIRISDAKIFRKLDDISWDAWPYGRKAVFLVALKSYILGLSRTYREPVPIAKLRSMMREIDREGIDWLE